ncbi:glycosyltransferase family 2 protein [Luteibaculum oceani]|uniref:Glycosyltransferase n=1 Tax=Luteibaculum oceani TaxID=1294296 RepID=A0A5C6V9K7_9FLAO|nr:glycosyltransferase family 2 protein [Luteibaculum oceani]TXC81394.1 glycosyltransferase [Luteibaculum oceani]
MRIHLITVCYNSEQTLGDTIKSVKSQLDCDFLYHAQDGQSKDGTVALLEREGVNFVSEQDAGLYDALNKAVANAGSQDIIGFIHADDVLASPDALKAVQVCFKEHPNADAVYGDLEYWNEDLSKKVRTWKSGKQASFAIGWMPPHPALYIKKSVFDKVGLFRLDMGSAADFEWMLRAIHIHKIKLHYLPKTLVKMRVGGMSNANLAARKSGLKYDLKAWEVNTGKKNYLAVLLKKLRKIPQYF